MTPRGVPSPSSLVPVLPTLLALQPRTRQAVSLLGSASLCPRPEVPSPEASGTSFPALLKSLWKLHLLRRASRAPRPLAGSGPQHLCTYYATYYLSCLLVKDFFLPFLIYSRCLRHCLSRGYSNALPNELRVPLDAHCSQDLKVCLEFVDCLRGPHLLSYMNSLQFALNANVCYVYDCTWPGQASDAMVPGGRFCSEESVFSLAAHVPSSNSLPLKESLPAVSEEGKTVKGNTLRLLPPKGEQRGVQSTTFSAPAFHALNSRLPAQHLPGVTTPQTDHRLRGILGH